MKGTSKKVKFKIHEFITCKEIIEQLNVKYKGSFDPEDNFAIIFIHQKYGEKILDEFECPMRIIENFLEAESFFKNI